MTTENQTLEIITTPTSMLAQIQAATVADEDRMDFLPKYFPNIRHGLAYENAVFNVASKLSEDYQGGFWDYVDFGDGVFFMNYHSSQPLLVRNDGNYSECLVDSHLFSLIVNAYVFSHLSFHYYDSNKELSGSFANAYHDLNDWFYGNTHTITDNADSTAQDLEQAKKANSAFYKMLD